MLIKRSADEIIETAAAQIKKNTPITNFKAGAIARSLTEAIAPEYETLYAFAEEILYQGFLSRANEAHLNFIGELFNYARRKETIFDEKTQTYKEELIDIEKYRYELSQQVHTAVKGNYEALRLACLSVSGVATIIGKEYSHGTGSFSFILITQYGFEPEDVKNDLLDIIGETKSFGVKPTVLLPVVVPFEISLELVFHETVPDNEKDAIRFETKSNLFKYIGDHTLEQPFIYNDFVQEVMNSHKMIVDFKVISFYLNNMPALLTNQPVMDDERIRPLIIEVL